MSNGQTAIDSKSPAKGIAHATESWLPSKLAANEVHGHASARNKMAGQRRNFMRVAISLLGAIDLKHLAQVGQVFLIVTHVFGRRV